MNINSSKRKVSRHESQECSQQSIVSAMDRFVTSVKNMEDTVLVPSRLMDMTADGDISKNNRIIVPQSVMNGTDLLSFYNTLNNIKTELIWGLGDGRKPEPIQDMNTLTVQGSRSRKTSKNSIVSESGKHSDSESETELNSESDSGLDSGTTGDYEEDPSRKISKDFQRHLSGLFYTLQQLAEVSDYLTHRYQKEVELVA